VIASTSIAIRLLLDRSSKRAVENSFSVASEVTKERVLKALERREQSLFEDCGDCGFDLRSEAERHKNE
jgi:hypothetical protein